MADKKVEVKNESIEREYTIPLREQVAKVPRYKKANKAIKTIKEFVARHMKIRDRDLNKIKIDRYLNEEVWFRGIKKPPAKIKVKAIKDGVNVRVELLNLPDKLKFKKIKEEKIETVATEKAAPKEVPAKAKEEHESHEGHDHGSEEKTEEKKEEAKEKKSAVVEAGQRMEKAEAKKVKHQTKQSKQPKHQIRKTLKK